MLYGDRLNFIVSLKDANMNYASLEKNSLILTVKSLYDLSEF